MKLRVMDASEASLLVRYRPPGIDAKARMWNLTVRPSSGELIVTELAEGEGPQDPFVAEIGYIRSLLFQLRESAHAAKIVAATDTRADVRWAPLADVAEVVERFAEPLAQTTADLFRGLLRARREHWKTVRDKERRA